jgi:pimeloyl-ACP methyl ester carboxylesterase
MALRHLTIRQTQFTVEQRVKRIRLLAGIVLCACSLPSPPTFAAGQKNLPEVPGFSDCSIGSGAAKLVAQCATINVPLDPESPESGVLALAVARIPARRLSKASDAFTVLAGGPGQSAIDSFPAVSSAFYHIMRDRDVILVDQRGTGGSARLTCPEAPEFLGLEFDVDTRKLRQLAAECLASLDHDPRLFSTSVAVRDLEYLRQVLGVSQWNLYGISYGTRVALHYLRRYPDAVRTMTLDAVVPPTITLGPDIAPLAQRSLDLIFERCLADPGCKHAFGDLRKATRTLLASLESRPRNITFEDIATGRLTNMKFTRQHLAVTLRLLSYSSQTAAILPSILHEAIVNDNFAPLARQAMLQTQSLGDSLATGMHHAVICTEDAPYMDADQSAEITEQTANSYMGDSIVDALKASCTSWPAGRIDADFRQAVSSPVPSLLLSGEADPITPPDYGNQVAATLPHSRHIVNPDQGHMQAPFGCMPVLLARFVEMASASTLQIECLERMRVLPFFVDANGPLP